jgi:hypothetical protein
MSRLDGEFLHALERGVDLGFFSTRQTRICSSTTAGARDQAGSLAFLLRELRGRVQSPIQVEPGSLRAIEPALHAGVVNLCGQCRLGAGGDRP